MSAVFAVPPPFTIDSLAERWGCSANQVRNQIRAGEIRTFKIGALVRIPAAEVERVECLNTVSSDSEVVSQSSTATTTVSGVARSLPRPIGLARRQRPANAGG